MPAIVMRAKRGVSGGEEARLATAAGEVSAADGELTNEANSAFGNLGGGEHERRKSGVEVSWCSNTSFVSWLGL
jgi:hypothetical protein